MQLINIPESELKKIANPKDVDEMKKAAATMQRLNEKVSKGKRRIGELDAILASNPKTEPAQNHWESALQDGDLYGGTDPRKELIEEHQHHTESVAFAESAIKSGRVPLDAVVGRISTSICDRERPAANKEIQLVVNALVEAREGFKRLAAQRDKLEQLGVRTGYLPINVSPKLKEEIERYFAWIKGDYPEVKLP